MKTKEVLGLLINPYTRITGFRALGLGMVFLFSMGMVGAYTGVAFDGVLDMHLSDDLSMANSFYYLFIDIFCVVFLMWIASQFVSTNFRLVNLIGTITLAKAPFLILALAGYFVKSTNLSELQRNPGVIFQSGPLLFISLLSLPVILWSIVLMYYALKNLCNAKGNKLIIALVLALVSAEIVSKILIHEFV